MPNSIVNKIEKIIGEKKSRIAAMREETRIIQAQIFELETLVNGHGQKKRVSKQDTLPEILRLLAKQSMTAKALSEQTGMSHAAINYHLSRMRRDKKVKKDGRGVLTTYRLFSAG